MQQLISILGPTASGKSSLAYALAQKLNTEIISCDSMQIYRELNIGSAKPTQEELSTVKHHIVDELDISEPWTAALFCEKADDIYNSYGNDSAPLIMAGGTGLYAKMFLYGADTLPSDKELARQLRDEYDRDGIASIYEKLKSIDPKAALRLKDNNRRIIRACEAAIILNTRLPERSFSDKVRINGKQIILMPSAELSRELIAIRCEEMLNEGWIEEGRQLIDKGLLKTPTAAQALGYKEIAQHLQGELTREELQEKLTIKTCQYAKRQRTWFRNQHPGAEIHNFSTKEARSQVFENILKKF